MQDFRNHTAFVTGGTGFVGSHLVELLLASGFREVRCLIRASSIYLDELPIVRVPGSMEDVDALRKGVRGVDYVFHVAALTRSKNWDGFVRANIDATATLLDVVEESGAGVKKVVITSSLAAVGTCDTASANETAPLRPVSMYGRSKAEMERSVLNRENPPPFVIVRPPAVYGPREKDIYTFFKAVRSGICPIVGDSHVAALSLVHVSDLVAGMLQAAVSPATEGETFFLGSPLNYSWAEIRDATATALGRRVLTIPLPRAVVPFIGAASEFIGGLFGSYPALNREKAREIVEACTMCDSSRARAAFGYNPSVDLWEGIRDTIAWYRREDLL